MPHQQALAVTARPELSAPEDYSENQLTEAVSAASLSFVACGGAVADCGELLQDLRLALQASTSHAASPEEQRAAALLAFRLQAVRGVLDEATAGIGALLEDCTTGSPRK